ncbi:FtsX-like permease family protein [Actinoplanes derwentensis]|uniref:Putative ABC transport system permease protein n=1 Tax=Actinoplanes derwentensis TaxID=113562 RepID=A0A1H1QGU9_9ACTN|nr:ABC transporter permease [Actinoplanes derwentensis]GID82140.1 membrane protein [Actinoplanes derwentensis]SDS22614.1 putative ABC transport system permease protein [Actinoplanes derwentensis]
MSVVLRTQLAGVGRRPARLLLTGLAVLVASFVVYATVLAQQITERSVLNGLSGTPEAAGLVVRDGDLRAADLTAISGLPGVAEAVARTDSYVRTPGGDLVVATDPGSGPLSTVTVTAGRYPRAPGEIAVTPRTAERMDLQVGATVPVTVGENGNQTLTVVGTVLPRDDVGFLAYSGLDTVRALSGGNDFVSRIDVRLDGKGDSSGVRQKVLDLLRGREVVPEVSTGQATRLAEARAAADEIDQLFIVVRVFVAVAVIAAGLIAASTFRIVFAQRMRQLALLRAVGAGRGALARALAAEGALTGLVAGLTGVLAALAVGHLLPPVLSAFGFALARPGFPLVEAVLTVLLAVLITVVAVLAPAFSAARVAPLEALRSAATTGARPGIGVPRLVTGLLFAAAAAGAAALVWSNLPSPGEDYDRGEAMLLGVVGSGGLAFIALIALGPVLVRPVLAVAGWPLRRLGPVGRLAVGGVGGSTRRAAAVSVVVALGVTLVTGVLVGGDSIRVLATREAVAAAPADFELRGPAGVALTDGVAARVRQSPEVTRVVTYRWADGITIGGMEGWAATDVPVASVPRLADLDAQSGSVADLAPGRAVLSSIVAEVDGLGAGDQVTVGLGGTAIRVTVAAVVGGETPLHTGVLLDPADLTRLGVSAAPTGLLADAAETGESGRTAGLRALRTAATAQADLAVAVLADQYDQVNDALAVLLTVALALIGLTVLIAVVGVGATTALSVVERSRESGLLRAVGMSRGGLHTMLTTESALYGVIGAVLGVLLGVPYAWLAVSAIGLDAPLTLPGRQLLAVFAVLVTLTALAGVLPARRAARTSPVTALGTD